MEDADRYKINNGLNPINNGALLTQMCINYVNSIKFQGYPLVGTYTNTDYFTNILNYSQIASVGEIWLAHWNVSSPPSNFPCTFGNTHVKVLFLELKAKLI